MNKPDRLKLMPIVEPIVFANIPIVGKQFTEKNSTKKENKERIYFAVGKKPEDLKVKK